MLKVKSEKCKVNSRMKINRNYFLLAFVISCLVGCKPEEIILDPPPSKLEGINGTFTLVEAIQVDPFVIAGDNDLDVTQAFTTDGVPSISFDASAFTYSFNPGGGPNYLGSNGTWAFDNNDYPTLVSMSTGSTQLDLKLLHTIRPQDEHLEVQLERSCGGTVSVIYQFKFARN
jgi:hypothetical protein